MRDDRYTALIERDWSDTFGGTVLLYVVRRVGYGEPGVYLSRDGQWIGGMQEGVALPEAGLRMPVEVLPALAEALTRYDGTMLHGDTESRVLREWLDAERKRVDEVLHARQA